MSSNTQQRTKTMTMKEYWALVGKSKAGWRSYFIMREEMEEMCEFVRASQMANRILRAQLENNEDVDIAHLKTQFIEMYDKLKDYTDCVVCLETIRKNNIEVPRCGHIICKECFETIKAQPEPKCPVCRKSY